MNTTSHKTIWRIAAVFAVAAGIAAIVRNRPPDSDIDTRSHDEQAVTARDHLAEELMDLLRTDWRVRRQPTQLAVKQLAAYAQHPSLDNAEAYFALALLYFYANEDIDAAQGAVNKAINLDSDWAWPYSLRGIILYNQGDRVEGLRSFHKAMELDPAWSRPYSDLAILHRLDEEWDRALEYAQRAIDLEPRNPIPYYNYGVILDFQGYHDEAKEYYARVLEINAELPAPYYNIACGYARNGNVSDSLKYLKIAIELDPAFHAEAQEDPDFDPIRQEERYREFMTQMRP